MLYSFFVRRGLIVAAALAMVLCQVGSAQDTQSREAKGIPPRAAPADYQAHASAGAFTVAAEFTGHSIATPQAILATEDYVVVEVALFGPPEARAKLSHEDFSLRINGKKVASPAQPYGMVFSSLKDPEWAPPEPPAAKSKTSIGGGGRGAQGDSGPPAPVHIPIEVERAMQQRVQKVALPEGERLLPEAGLIFFQYRGKINSIHSLELIYSGSEGKATLTLQP
jgi:hypothetical protein